MTSKSPNLLDLDKLIATVQTGPDSPSRAAALEKMTRLRATLVEPENATGEIGDILRALESGEIDTQRASTRFAELTYPSPTRSSSLVEQHDDPEALAPGSFAPIEAAYIGGRITEEQYATIVTAIMAATHNA